MINANKQFNYKSLMCTVCNHYTIGDSDKYQIRLDTVKWLVNHSKNITEFNLNENIFLHLKY